MTDDELPELPAGVRAFLDGMIDAAELDEDATNDAQQLVINWSLKGKGFGQVVFAEHDGQMHCDNECMKRSTVQRILELLTEGKSYDELPPLIRRYQTLDALLDAAEPRNPGPDWPSKGAAHRPEGEP